MNRIRMPWKRHLMPWKKKFGDLLYGRKWLNMGGGRRFTKPRVTTWKNWRTVSGACRKHMTLKFILSQGEAVALNAGYLETTVLDIVENNGIKILVLDTFSGMPYAGCTRNAVSSAA